MDQNRVKGMANQAAGKIEETIGSIAGDAQSRVSGAVREARGTMQESFGQVMDDLRGFTAEQPLTALLTVGALSLLLGMILGRR